MKKILAVLICALLVVASMGAMAEGQRVGVSMPSAGFDNVQSACRQAEFARLSSSEPGIRRCRDLALPFLLDSIYSFLRPFKYDLITSLPL